MNDTNPPTRPVPRWLLVFLIRHTVAYHLAELLARRLEFHNDVDPPLAVVVVTDSPPASRDALEERVTSLEQRLLQVEASLGGQGTPAHPPVVDSLARIADALAPRPADIVGTPYVAKKLGCTTVWIAEMVRAGDFPKNCIVPGTGNGKPWKFYRDRIDRWIESR